MKDNATAKKQETVNEDFEITDDDLIESDDEITYTVEEARKWTEKALRDYYEKHYGEQSSKQ